MLHYQLTIPSPPLLLQITDHVTGEHESCVQDHPEDGQTGSCASACANFEKQVIRTLDDWYMEYVGAAAQQWDALRLLADEMSARASP